MAVMIGGTFSSRAKFLRAFFNACRTCFLSSDFDNRFFATVLDLPLCDEISSWLFCLGVKHGLGDNLAVVHDYQSLSLEAPTAVVSRPDIGVPANHIYAIEVKLRFKF
jgi:hypothetical protein